MSLPNKKLSQLIKGDNAVIESFTDDVMKLKLLEMGCLPGEEIHVERFAPLGDPMAISVSGSVISIRIEEAENVLVRSIIK